MKRRRISERQAAILWAVTALAGCWWCLAPLAAQLAEAERGKGAKIQSASPDGRFACRYLFAGPYTEGDEPEGFDVVEAASKRVVLADAAEQANSFLKTFSGVWAKDSRHLALNFRSGGRYNTFALYAWNGKEFKPAPAPEALVGNRLGAAIQDRLKKDRVPKNTYLRRIWDSYRVERWIDARTVQIVAYSIRSYVPKGEPNADPEDVSAAFRFRIKMTADNKFQLLRATPISLDEAEKDE